MPQSTWKSIIEHAMTCKVGDSLYLYEVQGKDAGLFFDEIYQLVGAKFGDCYKPIDQLNEIEKVRSPHLLQTRRIPLYYSNYFGAFHQQNLVQALKQGAYQNIDGLQPNYKMVNNYPVLCSFPAQGTSLFSALHANQQTVNYGNA